MKRIGIVVVVLLLVATFCYAQVGRNPAYQYEGMTNFSNISVSGLDVGNNPGYIMLRGVGVSAIATGNVDTDTNINWFLWVDEDGDLCLASHVTISTYASFPTGTWDDDTMPICTKVGEQT